MHLCISVGLSCDQSPTSNMTSFRQESYNPKAKRSIYSRHTPKCFILVTFASFTFFLLLQISNIMICANKSFKGSISSSSDRPVQSSSSTNNNRDRELEVMVDRLRRFVTFLPLKDLRFAERPMQGHTWFMSSLNDTQLEGEVKHQYFPSKASEGRLLCIKGHHMRDGTLNSYALAWPNALPFNATLMKGLTHISYNHYDYNNICHGLYAMVPFAGWHLRNGCRAPTRWILYHWGELRTDMSLWLRTLLEATYGRDSVRIEDFDGIGDDVPVCFEEAVVMRHNEGGMSRERRMESYDLMRCKARVYCGLSVEGWGSEIDDPGLTSIRMTLLLRTGGRSFKNNSAVIRIFGRECSKVVGCRLKVAFSHNLTFCEQVKMMSSTDIVISAHGAQLSNLIFMDRNSSVMELFPKGWLKLAGVGQLVYRWLASWSGMIHQGSWHDPHGGPCPYPEDDRRCMSVYKNGQLGYDETLFSNWASRVLNETVSRKKREADRSNKHRRAESSVRCDCSRPFLI